ncbi:gamma-aminobutyrate transaminase POP2 [Cucumis melo var. makuwa]|uniref:Gamma-aminobutyrate transaminase POP2 n=1 Tax=Cucumis melo var. makuwa TaxID=1194695 RepID=A0A5A7U3V5_CUCMM|nr:gamma-aminobutyrate transaminase POP2 [Cucumis melo var. makuwa]
MSNRYSRRILHGVRDFVRSKGSSRCYFSASGMASRVMRDPDVISCSSRMASGREKGGEIDSADDRREKKRLVVTVIALVIVVVVGGRQFESSSQPSATPTPRRHAQSRLLGCVWEKKRVMGEKDYDNPKISVTIVPAIFVLDFNDQAMNRFVEHQMLDTFKVFRDDCHRHFKKYSDLEEARANPPHLLVGCDED